MKIIALISLVIMLSVATLFAESQPQGAGSLAGRVMISAKSPMANGIVLLYNEFAGPPPHPYRYWRIPDMIIPTEADGRFSTDLPEGRYFMMIAQKSPTGEIGPPSSTEFLYFHSDAAGNARSFTVKGGELTDLGTLSGAFVWSPDKIERDKGITSASGVVSDADGKPVSGVIVFAYLYQEAVGRPAFVSDRTAGDGKFVIRFSDGGTYFLKVRGVIGGGRPRSGEFMNVTDEFVPVMVTVKKEEKLKDVKLQVKMFSRPGEDSEPESNDKVWKRLKELQSGQ